jgi:hypothetical protein
MKHSDGYRLLAGKCYEICKAIASKYPEFILVRGHYYCPIWNQDRPHWWLKSEDDVIYDPTVEQFPSKGMGQYKEFSGMCPCSNCGDEIEEDNAVIEGNYTFCCYNCHGKFIGVF